MEVQKLGKYELRTIRGRGAMGVVYEAWDSVISRRVAIKTVLLPDPHDPEAQEQLSRFRREAQAAGRLNHPNIVAVHDYGETEEIAYIVMEFVDGESLKAVLDRGDRMSPEAIRTTMAQLLAGLAFSHEQGVVHRDIKPGNIMLTRHGTVKITDFGIARIESSSMTQSGTMLGTPAYMSPEQFMGLATDARTDIYSTGALLFQMLSGKRPFEGAMSAIMHKVLSASPPQPSIHAPGLAAFDPVIAKAMAKDPAHRFTDAAAFAAALKAAFEGAREALIDPEATLYVGGGQPTAAPSSAPITPPGGEDALARLAMIDPAPPGGLRSTFGALAAMLLGVAAFLSWYLLWPEPASQPPPQQQAATPRHPAPHPRHPARRRRPGGMHPQQPADRRRRHHLRHRPHPPRPPRSRAAPGHPRCRRRQPPRLEPHHLRRPLLRGPQRPAPHAHTRRPRIRCPQPGDERRPHPPAPG